MTRYLIEILIAGVVLAVALVYAASWWAVVAGVAGIFLGFGLFRYVLAAKLYKIAFNAATNGVLTNRGK
jgi:predicted anti-sigma-YlaC factor YlaD